MLQESRKSGSYQTKLEMAMRVIARGGYKNVRVELPDHEPPKQLVSRSENFVFTPDLTAEKRGAKSYFEIAQKTTEESKLVLKWKLLSKLAEIKSGAFHILVPSGHMKFTQNLVERHNIRAEIAKLELN